MFRLCLVSLALWLAVAGLPAPGPGTPVAFTCPVTKPGSNLPPHASDPFPAGVSVWYEDGIWVSIPVDGVLTLLPANEIRFGNLQGWRSATHLWMREDDVTGWIVVSGKRLDAPDDRIPQTPLSPQRQYVQAGFVETGIAFPAAGCWQVTGTVGTHSITWVMDVRFVDDVATPAA